MTFHEFVEIMVYASDLEEASLSRLEIIEKVLTRFYVSDPITRRAALIGLICGPTPDFIKWAKDQGPDPKDWILGIDDT
jgi:hypothetical protein